MPNTCLISRPSISQRLRGDWSCSASRTEPSLTCRNTAGLLESIYRNFPPRNYCKLNSSNQQKPNILTVFSLTSRPQTTFLRPKRPLYLHIKAYNLLSDKLLIGQAQPSPFVNRTRTRGSAFKVREPQGPSDGMWLRILSGLHFLVEEKKLWFTVSKSRGRVDTR